MDLHGRGRPDLDTPTSDVPGENPSRLRENLTGGAQVNPAEFGAENLTTGAYRELRGMAARQLARLPVGQSLQPTDLLHDALLRLSPGSADAGWRSRGHFFGAAARAIRNALVDHLRARGRIKRRGRRATVSVSRLGLPDRRDLHAVACLEEALERLQRHDARCARTLLLRVALGLTTAEVARDLRVSEATVERDFTYGRAWLVRELSGSRP